MPGPIPNYQEKVFFLDLAADRQDRTFVGLLNPDVGDGTPLGIVMRFNRRELPAFTEWKNPARGFYVLGLEPGNVVPLGRGVLRERGQLPMLAGQSSYSLKIDFQVLDTVEEMQALEKEAGACAKARVDRPTSTWVSGCLMLRRGFRLESTSCHPALCSPASGAGSHRSCVTVRRGASPTGRISNVRTRGMRPFPHWPRQPRLAQVCTDAGVHGARFRCWPLHEQVA